MRFVFTGTDDQLRALLNGYRKQWTAVHLNSVTVAHIEVAPHHAHEIASHPQVSHFPGHDSSSISSDLATALASEGVTSGMTAGQALSALHATYAHHLLDPSLPIM